MTSRELEGYRNRLLQRRKQLLETVKDTEAALAFLEQSRPAEFSEEAQEEATSFHLKTLGEGSWKELLEIQQALSRIDEKKYGSCESCGEKIAEKRLMALPTARLCIDCQRKEESHK